MNIVEITLRIEHDEDLTDEEVDGWIEWSETSCSGLLDSDDSVVYVSSVTRFFDE